MPLDTVRDQFIEATGRADLNDAGIAIGADFFINAGQRMLDRMLDGGKSFARYFVDVELQQILVPLAGCRAVKKVFCSDAEERWELTKVDIHKLREYYAEPKTSIDSDKPTYYSPIWARPYPNIVDPATFNQEWALDDIIDIGHEGFNAILIMPPSDSASTYTLEVLGLFHSDELLNDDDVSYWTEQYPELLIKAAAHQMEIFYRNTEGAKDWMGDPNNPLPGTILGDIKLLNLDIIEEEIAEVNQMEG